MKQMSQLADTIWKSGCLEPGASVLVGFSGGADSLALLDGLMELAPSKGLTVIACHVHHSIRGKEADEDAAFARQTADRLGAGFLLQKVDAPAYAESNHLSLEEAARILRYRALEEAARALSQEQARQAALKGKAPAPIVIAVAHNRDDWAETVLMRILRGTGPDGLAAMEPIGWTPEGKAMLVRPLLEVPAAATRAHCAGRGLLPREDSTNSDPAYVRNRVRQQLMPLLEQSYNPAAAEALVRLSRQAAEDADYLGQEAAQAFRRLKTDLPPTDWIPAIALDRRGLKSLHPAIGTRVIALALQTTGMKKDLSTATLTAAWQLLQRGRGAGLAQFAGGYALALRRDCVLIGKAQ